jgi:hypothetical protein
MRRNAADFLVGFYDRSGIIFVRNARRNPSLWTNDCVREALWAAGARTVNLPVVHPNKTRTLFGAGLESNLGTNRSLLSLNKNMPR